jgi:hypothetical protein
MKSLSIESQKFDYLKALHIILFATMMISCMLNSANVHAAIVVPSDSHLTPAIDMSSGTLQFAATFKMRPPRRLKRSYPITTDAGRQ